MSCGIDTVKELRLWLRGEHAKTKVIFDKNDIRLIPYEPNFKIGRPRKTNYEEIIKMRKCGHSLMFIANKLNISRGSVQHAIRTAK